MLTAAQLSLPIKILTLTGASNKYLTMFFNKFAATNKPKKYIEARLIEMDNNKTFWQKDKVLNVL